MSEKLRIFVLLLAGVLPARFSGADGLKPQPIRDDSRAASVLVELFTSEGCSDCPPADVLLQKLDRTQPVTNADLVVLSEHVDYWNHIGWRDPYSSHALSERQRLYAQHLNLQTVYTPQMIVDGESEFVGSDEQRALREIEKAARNPKAPVVLSSVRFKGGSTLEAHLRIGPLPSATSKDSARVFIGVADDLDKSHVEAGENSGRDLEHVAVLRQLTAVGTLDNTAGFDRDVIVNVDSGVSDRLRMVVFVQEAGPGRILGVTSAVISK